jgi:hypothetical protein
MSVEKVVSRLAYSITDNILYFFIGNLGTKKACKKLGYTIVTERLSATYFAAGRLKYIHNIMHFIMDS